MTTLSDHPATDVPAHGPRARRRMSFEQFLDLDGDVHAEWVDGEVVDMPPVSERHFDVVSFLNSVFREYLARRNLGRLLGEPFQMRAHADLPSRSPDLFVVLNDRLHLVKRNHLDGPADLVIEVTSPGTRRTDRVEKLQEYERGGVREYWILDPDRQLAEFYALSPAGTFDERVPDDAGVYRAAVLPDFWLRVPSLWQRPLPSAIDLLREIGAI